MANPHPHFLIITFPAQGHINPALELAKRLIGVGADVTFATTIHAKSRLVKNPTVDGLRFSTFSDGQEEGVKRGPNDLPVFQRLASENLSELIMASANEGRPISCLIYSILIPGAAELARSFNIPSAFLWIQPATVLDIYYYYFNGFGDLIRSKSSDPSFSIELPGLPSLSRQDLPSFFVGSDQNQENHALAAFQKHLEILEQEENPKALVNTFDALEPEALRAVEKLKLTAVGPLFHLVSLMEKMRLILHREVIFRMAQETTWNGTSPSLNLLLFMCHLEAFPCSRCNKWRRLLAGC